MKTVQILEPNDRVNPDDWCRPLRLVSMSGGHSDFYAFESMYSGTPENNVKWVRIKDVFGEYWFGRQAKELMEHIQYEIVRGDMPAAHRLKGFHSLANVRGHAPASGSVASAQVDGCSHPPKSDSRRDAGCCAPACSPLFIPVSRSHGLGQNFECGACGMLMLREREECYDTLVCEWPRCEQLGVIMRVPPSHPEILPRCEYGKTETCSPHSAQE